MPEKPHHVRIEADLWAALEAIAKKERLSVAKLIDRSLAEMVEAQGELS